MAAFRKNLIEMSELEIKHARVSSLTLQFRDCQLIDPLFVEIDRLRFRVVFLASLRPDRPLSQDLVIFVSKALQNLVWWYEP